MGGLAAPGRVGRDGASGIVIPLTLSPPGRPLRALFLGAHADDIEIGCGGTIRRLIDASAGLEAHWRVFSASDEREAETRRAAEILLEGASAATVEVDRFRESYLPWQGDAVKERVAGLAALAPDVVFTHARHDRHQDHRLLSDLAWNTFRDQLVLEYEIPKWDGDLVTPNLYVPLDRVTGRHQAPGLARGVHDPGAKAVVRRGHLSWPHAASRCRVRRAGAFRRGLPHAEGGHVRRLTTRGRITRRGRTG